MAEFSSNSDSSTQEFNGDNGAADSNAGAPQSGRLDPRLVTKAEWKIRLRWLRTILSYLAVITIASEHTRIAEFLIANIGELLALGAMIVILVAPYVWAELRRLLIAQKWDNTAPQLNATMRLDCAKAYTRALRLYVNLKQASMWVMLWGAAALFIGLKQLLTPSLPFAEIVTQQQASAIFCALGLLVLWRGYVLGHAIFHPGASLVKSILWLHIQAHDPDTSASEKAEMLIEDQIKIRKDHPIWYMDYEISGPRQA